MDDNTYIYIYIFACVAERISYFCLARNLIRPLGSTHNFTQSGWLILFIRTIFPGSTNWGSHQTLSLPQNFFVQDRRLTVCSSIAAAASHHHEESRLIYGPLASILLDQGFSVEYELDEPNTPHTGTTFSRLQNCLCRLRCKITLRHQATSSLGNIFWRHSRFSRNNQNHKSIGDYIVSVLKQQTHLLLHYGEHISLTHNQRCLNLTMHFSLRHLAAKMLSQLYNNFISFPYFFPSCETCSINVNPLFHAAIKTFII